MYFVYFIISGKPLSGKIFAIAFLKNLHPNGHTEITIYAEQETTITVEVLFDATIKTFHMKEYDYKILKFPPDIRTNSNAEDKGILITSHKSIVIQSSNWISGSSGDACHIFPVTEHHIEFLIIQYHGLRQSRITIVATEDNTQIIMNHIARELQKYTINRLQTFSYRHNESLTGMLIKTSKPVSVFTGSKCTNVPSYVGSCSALYTNTLPVYFTQKSTNLYASPIAGRNDPGAYLVRIMAQFNSTDIYVFNSNLDVWTMQAGNKNKGEYIDVLPELLTKDVAVSCSRPCSAIQVNAGKYKDNSLNTNPFLMDLLGFSNFVNYVPFVTVQDENDNEMKNYITVVTAKRARGKISLDGVSLYNEVWNNVPGWSNMVYTSIHLSYDGLHHVSSATNNALFALYIYGHGRGQAYGFLGGFAGKL